MVLEQFITLALSDFTRAGMFTPSTRQQIRFEWDRGTDYASITAVSDFTGYVPFVVLSYYHNGRPVEQGVTLRWHDLYNGGGFYYFVCPVSGLSCEKLYFSDKHGQFIGRVATRAPYLNTLRTAERLAIRRRPYLWKIRRDHGPAVTV